MNAQSKKDLLLLLGVLVVVVTLYSQCGNEQTTEGSESSVSSAAPAYAPAPTPAQGRPASADARLEECRAKLKAAVPLELVTNMSFDGGRPKLWVGPTWHQVPIDAKEGLAREAACFFLAGDEAQTITFPIYDGRTGKQIATWKFTRLDVE